MLDFEIRKNKDKKEDDIRNVWCFNDKRLVNYVKPLSVGAVNKSLSQALLLSTIVFFFFFFSVFCFFFI